MEKNEEDNGRERINVVPQEEISLKLGKWFFFLVCTCQETSSMGSPDISST